MTKWFRSQFVRLDFLYAKCCASRKSTITVNLMTTILNKHISTKCELGRIICQQHRMVY